MGNYSRPANSVNRQTGFMPEKISRSSAPLDVRESNFQIETGQERAYVVKSQKMPTIELVANSAEGGKIGSIPSNTTKTFRAEPVRDNFGVDENFHDQFVKPNQIDSVGSFGMGA